MKSFNFKKYFFVIIVVINFYGCASIDDYVRPTERVIYNPKISGGLRPLDFRKNIMGKTILFDRPLNSFTRNHIIYFGRDGKFDRLELTPDGMFVTPRFNVINKPYFMLDDKTCIFQLKSCFKTFVDDSGIGYLIWEDDIEIFKMSPLAEGDKFNIKSIILNKEKLENDFFLKLNKLGEIAAPIIRDAREKDAKKQLEEEERKNHCFTNKAYCY